jgi:hypothetical protein
MQPENSQATCRGFDSLHPLNTSKGHWFDMAELEPLWWDRRSRRIATRNPDASPAAPIKSRISKVHSPDMTASYRLGC